LLSDENIFTEERLESLRSAAMHELYILTGVAGAKCTLGPR
jgi:hypothetical protein